MGVLADEVVDEESWVMMTSPSIPASVMWVMRREPSRRRPAPPRRSDPTSISRMVRGERIAAHGDHRLDAGERLARAVGVQRAHRAVMAGIHRLQQVERLRCSPTMMRSGRMRRQLRTRSRIVIWPSPSRFGGRVSGRTVCGCCGCNSAASSQVMMRSSSSIAGEAVEQRGLARAGAAGDDGVDPATADHLEDLGAGRGDRAEVDELLERELVLLELADGERRAVDGERRHDDVDARPVGQPRVADRRDSSTRRPIWLTMRWQMLRSWWLSRKRSGLLRSCPALRYRSCRSRSP